ncbi:MFS multidrug transporter [Acrodontium crateriforme]|uniref:MFS multidrug transporter n=1 Tax=Acrodontium crateriforme TaxID=150365 RepID=A0AAQ3RCG2_9PEZI|nr:MFS multidrug transporter [Acrodontium crateriforme]
MRQHLYYQEMVLRTASPASLSPLRSIIAAFTIQLLLSIGSNMPLTPQTAILQDIVCKQYYEGAKPLNSTSLDCTIEPVIGEVARIIGWEYAIENIPNMLLAVPFGILADRYGRKRVLLLALFGSFMNDAWIRLVYWFPETFPVHTVWFAGAWQSIGAGAATLSSITHALVADACTEEQRTSAFSQIRSAKLLSQMLFVPLGGALIVFNPWLPMFIATGFTISGLIAAVLLVPADQVKETHAIQSDETRTLLETETAATSSAKSSSSPWHSFTDQAKRLAGWVAGNSRLIPLILSFFVFQLGEQAGMALLLQYAAKRLEWSLTKASFLISVRAGVNLSALIIMVPALSFLLMHKAHRTVIKKDKWLAQGSGALLVAGCIAVFFATTPFSLIFGLVLISFGDVFAIPVRSLSTALVDPSHLGLLYNVIEVMTQIGLFIGQPMLASAFGWGLRLGGFWMGLPFLLAAVFFLLALIAVSSTPTSRRG